MQFVLPQLNQFFGVAALATYAGGAEYIKPEAKGFNELEYREGDWYYRDSYTGYFKSFGREVIRYQDRPVWTQHYGGGMEAGYKDDLDFTRKTFQFLKQALATARRGEDFRPRGPKELIDGDWTYRSGFVGGITKFCGNEEILYNNALVFTHHYFGGVVVEKGE